MIIILDLEVKTQRAEERKKLYDMEAAKECTFSPNTVIIHDDTIESYLLFSS